MNKSQSLSVTSQYSKLENDLRALEQVDNFRTSSRQQPDCWFSS